jgi:hypothetical protein
VLKRHLAREGFCYARATCVHFRPAVRVGELAGEPKRRRAEPRRYRAPGGSQTNRKLTTPVLGIVNYLKVSSVIAAARERPGQREERVVQDGAEESLATAIVAAAWELAGHEDMRRDPEGPADAVEVGVGGGAVYAGAGHVANIPDWRVGHAIQRSCVLTSGHWIFALHVINPFWLSAEIGSATTSRSEKGILADDRLHRCAL